MTQTSGGFPQLYDNVKKTPKPGSRKPRSRVSRIEDSPALPLAHATTTPVYNVAGSRANHQQNMKDYGLGDRDYWTGGSERWTDALMESVAFHARQVEERFAARVN
jgi:hypothetical protein